MAGAPIGNQNNVKAKRWASAINEALEARSRRDGVVALNEIAAKMLDLALAGDLQAMKELGDRLDGKAAQSVALTNPDGGDLFAPLVAASEALRESIRGKS